MDWDGIGTFALCLSSGAVGLGVIAFKAYAAKLASKIEMEQLRRSSPAPDELTEHMRYLEDQVQRLTERVDFTERLIGQGSPETSESSETQEETAV